MKVLKYLFLISLLFPKAAQCQSSTATDSLKLVSDVPYICELPGTTGCGDKLFWNAVRTKNIEALIKIISDSTKTKAPVMNFGGVYSVGDIAYVVLQEIIHIPTFELLNIEFDKSGCGYCSYWNYVRADIENRKRFQSAVDKWYHKNQSHFVWVTTSNFSNEADSANHPNGGHFELRR